MKAEGRAPLGKTNDARGFSRQDTVTLRTPRVLVIFSSS